MGITELVSSSHRSPGSKLTNGNVSVTDVGSVDSIITNVDTDKDGDKKGRLVVVLITLFLGAICFALQAPFYPAEAAIKGVRPTEYGFVFGVFQLSVLITSPLYGRYIKAIGSPFLFKCGVFIAAGCTILFGFLDLSPPGKTFLYLSIAIRVVAALGESALYTASYVIAIRCSPASAMATAIAYVEISFGMGSILGPTVGGALYQIGGFRLPFFVTGSLLMVGCFISMYFIRDIEEVNSESGGPNIFRLIRSPSILAFSYSIFSSATTVGFFSALIEPNVRPLGLSALQVGLLFMANGATYAVSAALWGRVVDKVGHANSIIVLGSVCQIIGILFIGPVPFIPLEKSVVLVTIGLILCGFGSGCNLVSSVVGIMDGIVACGYLKNMAAQGFVSGIYNALFAAGCFAGPTLGGYLFEQMGFPKSSLVIWVMHIITVLFVLVNKGCLLRQQNTLNSSTWLVAHSKRPFDRNGSLSQVELSYDSMTGSTSNGIKTIA